MSQTENELVCNVKRLQLELHITITVVETRDGINLLGLYWKA